MLQNLIPRLLSCVPPSFRGTSLAVPTAPAVLPFLQRDSLSEHQPCLGIQTYEDFVMNAYLSLLLGILFRLPMLATCAQFAAVQTGPPVEHFLHRSVQKPVHQPWMR